MADSDAIVLEGVWKYFGDYPAIRDVSFRLPQSECLALIGRNGAGSSSGVSAHPAGDARISRRIRLLPLHSYFAPTRRSTAALREDGEGREYHSANGYGFITMRGHLALMCGHLALRSYGACAETRVCATRSGEPAVSPMTERLHCRTVGRR